MCQETTRTEVLHIYAFFLVDGGAEEISDSSEDAIALLEEAVH